MLIGIVAVDNNWGIGKDNQLLFHIKEDMKLFKTITTHHIVCMGRKTFLSLPNGPLAHRINMVLSTSTEFNNCINIHSIDEILNYAKYNDIYIIGGASLYKQMLPFYDKIYVTKIFANKAADVYFPNIDTLNEFTISSESDIIIEGNYKFKFLIYEKEVN